MLRCDKAACAGLAEAAKGDDPKASVKAAIGAGLAANKEWTAAPEDFKALVAVFFFTCGICFCCGDDFHTQTDMRRRLWSTCGPRRTARRWVPT